MSLTSAQATNTTRRSHTDSLTSTLVSSSDSDEDSSTSSAPADSSSDSDSDDDQDQDDQDEDEDMAKLSALLLQAKQSARQRAAAAGQGQDKGKAVAVAGDELADNQGLVMFGDDDDDDDESGSESGSEEDASTPRPSTSRHRPLPPSLVRPLHLRAPTSSADPLALGKGKLTLAQDLGGAVVSEGTGTTRGEKWGKMPQKLMSKKERKAAQPPTAGPKWFNMPTTPLTPSLKRELTALRLRNSLDPKTFYKSSALLSSKQLPEFFQLGHVITPAGEGRSVSSGGRGEGKERKRTFVEELVEDEVARARVKRKTKEVMERGMSGRRGGNRKGASKRVGRKQ